jgi:MFS family permease
VLSFAGAAGYHPVAGRVVIGMFPEAVGKAIGLAGIGAGLGFLFGPWFSGFRTELAGWHAPLWDATAWRAPMLEAGCFALAVALVYSLTTREPHLAPHHVDVDRGRATPRQKRDLILLICLLGVALIPREFANAGLEALGSLFFQRGYGLAVGTVGLVLAFKGLISLVTNPLVALLSDRGHRLWWLSAMWLGCGVCGALVPWLPPLPAQIALILSGTFMLANYPVFESALLERLPAHIRGRAYSLILAIVGAAAAFAPKLMGRAVDGLSSAAGRTVPAELFRPLFALLAVAVAVSLVAIPLLVALKGQNERFGR